MAAEQGYSFTDLTRTSSRSAMLLVPPYDIAPHLSGIEWGYDLVLLIFSVVRAR